MPDEEDDERSEQPDLDILRQAMGGDWDGQPLPASDDSAARLRDAALSSGTVPPPPTVDNPPLSGDRVPTVPYSGARPSLPAPQPPPDPNPAPAMTNIPFDMSKIPSGLLSPPATPASVPKPPTGSSNPNLADLAREQAMYGKPLDPKQADPVTGKPIYKMGIKDRILYSALNGVANLSHHPTPPVYVGPGATNARYARDEATREGKLANVNTQIGTQKTIDTENEKLYEDATRQAYEGQLGAARTRTADALESRAATAGELADTKTALSKSQVDLNEARAKKAGEDKTPTSEFSGWYSSFKQENKRPPTAKEIQQYELQKARAGKDTTEADTRKAIQVAEYKGRQLESIDRQKEAERTRRYAELEKDLTESFVVGQKRLDKSQAGKAKIDSDLDAKYAPKVQQMSDEADKMLGLTKSGAALQSSSSTTPNAAPKAPPKAGDTIMVKDKSGNLQPRKVLGFNPTTKKPIVAPAGQ